MADKYGGPVNKHQELAQTGHVDGYAKGGSVHHSSGGHTSMKHENQHHGHGKHGHKGPHEHYTSPGGGEHSGHKGNSVHTLVNQGKNTPEELYHTHTTDIETDGGGDHSSGSDAPRGTGSTRNRI
jgi:hypothetical protein